ncbi:glycosyltransferase [Capnocytophaga ochracea]|nr:glycosyltransferase [Capnocytophaga ochracea]
MEGWSIRKETERFGREEGGFLVKKGYKEGGVSL